jgi:hypothetical protein
VPATTRADATTKAALARTTADGVQNTAFNNTDAITAEATTRADAITAEALARTSRWSQNTAIQ